MSPACDCIICTAKETQITQAVDAARYQYILAHFVRETGYGAWFLNSPALHGATFEHALDTDMLKTALVKEATP